MNAVVGNASFDLKNTESRKEVYGAKVELKEGGRVIKMPNMDEL